MDFPQRSLLKRELVLNRCTSIAIPGPLLTVYRAANCAFALYRRPRGSLYTILIGLQPGTDSRGVVIYNRVNGPTQVVRMPGNYGLGAIIRIRSPRIVIAFAPNQPRVVFDMARGRFR